MKAETELLERTPSEKWKAVATVDVAAVAVAVAVVAAAVVVVAEWT